MDDPVFAIALGVYLDGSRPEERTARAELRVDDRGSCGDTLQVDELLSIWSEDAAPPRP